MQNILTSVFRIDIPDFFDDVIEKRSSFRAESHRSEFDQQCPHIRINLRRIEDVDNDLYKGETFAEKLEDSFLGSFFKAEKLKSEERTVQDKPATLIYAKTEAAWQDVHFNIKYLFASILLNDVYYLDVVLMHEPGENGQLDAWVAETFDSIKVLGDAKIWNQAFVADVAAEEAEWQRQEKLRSGPKKQEYEILNIPEDSKEQFTVGDFDFGIPDSKIEVEEFSNELLIRIAGKTESIKAGIKAQVLDDYPGDGQISLEVRTKGILIDGKPKGEFHFEDGKTEKPSYLYVRESGFDHRLAFNGTVRIEDGWVLMNGEMTKSYHDKSFPIRVIKKFNMESLNWKNYRYTSMEEIQAANPKDIRFLSLGNAEFVKLPELLFTFQNLEELDISWHSYGINAKKLPLSEIQADISLWRNLRKFHIAGATIESLPETLGELQNLEHLSITNCDLEYTPNSIWKLPKLKYLWLSSNRLRSIPEGIDLPELQNISLEKNQLQTLPESLAKQPKLKKIGLEDNSLESLPQAFNEIEAVELSLEDKKRLLDFEYKGADGTGLVTWDDAAFWSLYDTGMIAEVEQVLDENKVEKYREALKALVKRAVGFKHQGEEDYKAIGSHRFGGMPDLPTHMQYPEYFDDYDKKTYKYEFIAQINCAELEDFQNYLPRKGMLYFFLETIHSIYGGHNNPCKVVYVEDVSNLVSGRRFNFSKVDYYEMYDGGYTGFKVVAKKMNSAPSFYASYVNTHLFLGEAEVLKDDEDFLEEAYDIFEEPLNQKNEFEYAVNAYGFAQHEHPELQAALKRKGKAEDWIILLTVTSSGSMQWGDAGDLFFTIHKSDLAKGDFSNVFVTMESS